MRENDHAWIEELRLASPAGAPVQLGDRVALHWLAGAFAFDENYTKHQATDYRPGGVLYGLWPFPFQMNNDANLDNIGASLFGQTTFTLDKRWELGLGLRDDFEHRSADLNSRIPPGPILSSSDPSRDFNQVSPRASLGYRFAPGILAYTEVSKGYRAGGFNAVSPSGHASYDEEVSWNYEAGLKTAWLDNRLIANVAMFHTDWEDIQVNSHVPGGNVSDYYIENGGKARSQGSEIELTVKPLKGLDLFGGVGLVDAEYRAGSHSADMDVGGNDLPFAPRFNWHAGSEYTEELAAHRRTFARIEVVGTGRYYYDPSNLESQGSYELVNAKLGLVAGAWRVEGWVKNLLDRDYVPLAIPYGQDAQGNPFYIGESGAPRTVGISLARTF
jgi:iron complex outermembrane receptor protein